MMVALFLTLCVFEDVTPCLCFPLRSLRFSGLFAARTLCNRNVTEKTMLGLYFLRDIIDCRGRVGATAADKYVA